MATDMFGNPLDEEERFRLMMGQQALGLTPTLAPTTTPMLAGPAVDTFVDMPAISPVQQPQFDFTTPTYAPTYSVDATPTFNTDPVALNQALAGPLSVLNQEATGNFTGIPSIFGTGTQVAGGFPNIVTNPNWSDFAPGVKDYAEDEGWVDPGGFGSYFLDPTKDLNMLPALPPSGKYHSAVDPTGGVIDQDMATVLSNANMDNLYASAPVNPQTDQDYLNLGVTPLGSDIAHPAQSPLLDQRYLEQPDKQTVTQDIGDYSMSPEDINTAMSQASDTYRDRVGGLKGILGTNIPFTNSQIGDIVNLDPTETGGYIDKQGTIEKMVRLGLMTASQANQAKQKAWQADENTNFAQMLAQMLGTTVTAVPVQMWDDGILAGLKSGTSNIMGVHGGYGGSQMDAMIEMMAKGDKTVEEVAEVLPTLAAMDISTNPTKGSRTLDGKTIDKAYTSFDDIATVPTVAPTVPAYTGPTQAEINAAKRATDLANQKAAARAKAAADRLAALRAKQDAADKARQVQDAKDRAKQKKDALALLANAAGRDKGGLSAREIARAIEIAHEIDTFASGGQNMRGDRDTSGERSAGMGGGRGGFAGPDRW